MTPPSVDPTKSPKTDLTVTYCHKRSWFLFCSRYPNLFLFSTETRFRITQSIRTSLRSTSTDHNEPMLRVQVVSLFLGPILSLHPVYLRHHYSGTPTRSPRSFSGPSLFPLPYGRNSDGVGVDILLYPHGGSGPPTLVHFSSTHNFSEHILSMIVHKRIRLFSIFSVP